MKAGLYESPFNFFLAEVKEVQELRQFCAKALAEIDVNITDLNTRLIQETGEQPLYAMMLEVAPPPGLGHRELEEQLRKVAGEQQLEVSVRELATDSL